MKENPEKKDSEGKVEKNSAVSKNSDGKVEEKSTTKFTGSFLKKFDFMSPVNESEKKDDKSEDKVQEQDPHAFPMMSDFISSDKIKNLKSRNNKLVIGIGIFVGALLISSGVFLMMGSPERVADNAEFGDMASFSVFLILAGILLIAGVLAHRFLDKSFFKGINKELEPHNGTSSNSTKKEYKKG